MNLYKTSKELKSLIVDVYKINYVVSESMEAVAKEYPNVDNIQLISKNIKIL